MGVTIEQYRSCIGCFNPYFLTKKSKKSRQVKIVSPRTWSSWISILIAIIICLNIFTGIGGYPTDNSSALPEEVAYYYNNPELEPTHPFTKPTQESQPPPWPALILVKASRTCSLSTPPPPWPGIRLRLRLGQKSTSSAGSFLEVNPKAMSSFTAISNFISRYVNGNKKNQGIKIAQWNKGNAFLQSKMAKIESLVSGLHPHILGISEANLHHHHDQDLVQLQDYHLHTCQTLQNPTIHSSRIVTYTHKSIIAKIRPDLM